ncbi:MAG: AAA family ATPase [Lentisphaerae bacterium]|nr:AAA family ATPase [Lentisphaerota bacterium]MBT7056394.1 AAA family ATPase [Lentisphaerota bacterium]MBT7848234.1 AAA family ATPase [Lentisphaerota bacterium]
MHDSELAKLTDYFDEGRRLWGVNAELVVSRQFYTLWEDGHRPKAFGVSGDEISLFGHSFTLSTEEEHTRVATIGWDDEEMCAVLVIEGESCAQRYRMTFADGEPCIEEGQVTFFEDTELTFGERLEVMYDVIAALRRSNPARDVLTVTKKVFLEALEEVAPWHDGRARTVMRRLSMSFIRRLMRKAAEDMAEDELSDQLVLPLGGSYASAAASQASAQVAADILPVQDQQPAPQVMPRRTLWAVEQTMQFLGDSCRINAETERAYLIPLAEATIIGHTEEGHPALRVPTDPELPLQEGDRLEVIQKGEKDPVGTLWIDVFDGPVAYGHIVWRDADSACEFGDNLVARPQKNPALFISKSLEALQQALFCDDDEEQVGMSAVACMVGLQETPFVSPSLEGAPAEMDTSQRRGWGCAVSEENPVALIQGPPGTGKTRVLVGVLKTLCERGKRVLVTAPSNTAVDNICRRALQEGLPILRFGWMQERIAPDVSEAAWVENVDHVRAFAEKRSAVGGGIYAGTHVGLLRANIVMDDYEKNGPYDVVVFDEAGMTRMDEFLLCSRLAGRAVLFGDHQQLPPFPPTETVVRRLIDEYGVVPRSYWTTLHRSALQWLVEERSFPVVLLQRSYRCQNPRLMRSASTLFYDARVRASEEADYYQLSYAERQRRYPPSSLRLLRTSDLPAELRCERLLLAARRPGLENGLEAELCRWVFRELAQRYSIHEITVIAPYRRQVRLLRKILSWEHMQDLVGECVDDEEAWWRFLRSRISTVDSFQGGESDAVIICYVRSNADGRIGFVDDPNRVNVAHTRCRREMTVIGDFDCLRESTRNRIFKRMGRAFERDGEVIDVTLADLESWGIDGDTIVAQNTEATKGTSFSA